jgi:predicted LPLAT superfamily acyltransferase
VLECPVFFVAAVFSPPNRYDVHCAPLFERVVLPRGRREAAIAEHAAAFAARLEPLVGASPFNWFNFFPFWEDS